MSLLLLLLAWSTVFAAYHTYVLLSDRRIVNKAGHTLGLVIQLGTVIYCLVKLGVL